MTAAVALAACLALMVWSAVRRARDETYWRASAEKLGRTYGIPAREDIVAKVGASLRRRDLAGLAPAAGGSATMIVLFGPSSGPSTGRMVVVLAIAVGIIACDLAWWLRRSWNHDVDTARVAHLGRPTSTETFTLPELLLLAAGGAYAVLAGSWYLTHVDRPVLAGLWSVTLAAGFACAWLVVRALLARPSSAGDDLELGWDDVLRHIEVRRLAAIVSCVPVLVTTLLLCRSAFAFGNLVPVYLVAALAGLWTWTFRSGRTKWQDRWNGQVPA